MRMHVIIKPSTRREKKYMAIFTKKKDSKTKTVHFGAAGCSDYTQHHDNMRKKRYILRHEPRENWNNYMTPGALSRWILWNKKTISDSIKDYKKRFRLT